MNQYLVSYTRRSGNERIQVVDILMSESNLGLLFSSSGFTVISARLLNDMEVMHYRIKQEENTKYHES